MRHLYVSVLLVCAACTSTTVVTKSDPAATDGGESGPPETGSETNGTTDAGADAAPTKQTGTTVETSETAQSCDAICSAKGYACGPTTCKMAAGGVGLASYSDETDKTLANCSETPAATSGSAQLSGVSCCCATPWILAEGPAAAPKSCNDVCAAKKLECQADHAWGDGTGGAEAAYERLSTGGIRYRVFDCATAPPKTINLPSIAEDGVLRDYTCACIDGP